MCVCVCVCVCAYVYKYIDVYTYPSERAQYDTKLIFKRALRSLNSEFSFSKSVCLTMTKYPKYPTIYL